MNLRKKRAAFGAIALSVMASVATAISPVTTIAATNASYVSLGADLTADQKNTVYELLGVKADELSDDNIVTVTNAEEHEYLDKYLDKSIIGTRALSSAKVTGASSGSGITVTTKNINYITEDMYKSALATAGMKDADVVVAGPTSISGTAGLIGAMKAYSKMTGQVIEPNVIETATAELVTSGEIAESTGDSDKTTQLIAAAKEVVVNNNITNETDIRNTINNISNQLNITLSDSDVDKLVDLLKQISKLDIDADTLTEQAKSIYEAATKNGLDLSQYGISSADVNSFFDKLPGFIQAFINWLRGIFSGS